MDANEYSQHRLEDQINWYDKKSQQCQKRFKILKCVEIILAASIPFGMTVLELAPTKGYIDGFLKIAIASMGVIIAVIGGLLSLHKYYENWMAYRTTCEMLKHEKYFFETGCGPYKKSNDPFCLLVTRTEKLISEENTNWQKYMIDKSNDQEQKPNEQS